MNQIEDSRYLLSTTYFGPIQWYQKLCRYDCLIDGEERFIKQTYRNRCVIATTQGTQALTVPVEHVEVGRLKDELRSGASQVRSSKCEVGSNFEVGRRI